MCNTCYVLLISLPSKPQRDIGTHPHTHPFNGPLSGTTQVSRYYRKVYITNLDVAAEARDSEWQWHQLVQ